MQTLKDEIRERMLAAAMEEFIERGFPEASMRSIAKRAFISVSNLYNYFSGKEDLFYALADPAYRRFETFIDTFMGSEPESRFDDEDFVARFGELLLEEIGAFLITHRDEMLLLMDKSGGTRYGNLKTAVIELLENHFMEEVEMEPGEHRRDGGGKGFIMHVVATNLLEGILEILRHGADEGWMREALGSFIHYHVRGFSFLAK